MLVHLDPGNIIQRKAYNFMLVHVDTNNIIQRKAYNFMLVGVYKCVCLFLFLTCFVKWHLSGCSPDKYFYQTNLLSMLIFK